MFLIQKYQQNMWVLFCLIRQLSGTSQKRQGHPSYADGKVGIASTVQKLRVRYCCANFGWNDCLFIGIR